MKNDKYENVIAATDFLEFEFMSVGPKGNILKLVQFTSTSHSNIFNLAFGNKTSDGLDDLAIDDNTDRNKILATVSTTVYEFCKHYPNNWVFFSGSTLARTRLYRMEL